MSNAHPEALLISAILRTDGMDLAVKHGIRPDLFTLHPDEAEWLYDYYERYGKTPGKLTFKNKFPDFVVFKIDDVSQMAEEVKNEYARSELATALDQTVKDMLAGDVAGAANRLTTTALSVQASIADNPGDYDVGTDASSTFDMIAEKIERVKKHGRAGVPTGFDTLDDITGGYQPGWLTVVAGRLGMGKTWTMVRSACAAVFDGYTAQYYSLEQSRHQIAMRSHTFMSVEYGHEVFRATDLMRGTGFDMMAYKRFLEDIGETLDGKLIINDTTRGRVSPMTIAAGIERNAPDIVFVDYLTLMEMQGDGGWKSVGKLSADLKQIAERYQVPIVAASQVNRSAGLDTPGTEHLSQADAIGHDADMVITMVKKSPSVMKMKLAKFRHGQDGVTWWAQFQPGDGKYAEITKNQADALIQQDADKIGDDVD